ncbi:Hypothetical_protein [Hexamita inflata]|uniref:Hypothetical_protein n=1 Tax=Hexamita inflata TaxID=28002 RepID=A0AA86NRU8_9EUKA|nr:Hypothetical protein HINF_LOCUS11351 [Hexamita inflata]
MMNGSFNAKSYIFIDIVDATESQKQVAVKMSPSFEKPIVNLPESPIITPRQKEKKFKKVKQAKSKETELSSEKLGYQLEQSILRNKQILIDNQMKMSKFRKEWNQKNAKDYQSKNTDDIFGFDL